MSERFEFIQPGQEVFVSDDGDFFSGGLIVDTRLWTDADWKAMDDEPRASRQALAIRLTQLAEESFGKFIETLRDTPDSTIEVRRFIVDDDGVTEVDEDDNPI